MANPTQSNKPPGSDPVFKKTGEKTAYKSKTADINAEQLRKVRGYKMMIAGAMFLIVPSIELYRRLYNGGERRIQQGEFNPKDGTIKQWEEEEKVRNFKESWLTRLFGEK